MPNIVLIPSKTKTNKKKKHRTRVLYTGKKQRKKDNIDYCVAIQIVPYQQVLGAVFGDNGSLNRQAGF